MSAETMTWLNTNTLVGFAAKRGTAWHYRPAEQGAESNHYDGAIPVDDVVRRLFHWEAVSAPVAVLIPCDLTDERMTGIGADGRPFRLVIDEDRQAMVRDDNDFVMGVFKQGYRGHAYRQWLIGNVSNLLDGDLSIGSAGLLRGGAVAWVQVERPDTLVTPSGVTIRPNLLASTSFDGSLATGYRAALTNTVCDNTMAVAITEADDAGKVFRVAHTKYSNLKIAAARDALDIVFEAGDAFTAEIERMTNTPVTDDQFARIISTFFEDDKAESERAKTIAANRTAAIHNLWANDLRVQPWAGTAWGAFQAFNTWAQHVQTVRGATHRFDRNMDAAVTGKAAKFDAAVLATISGVLTPA